MNKKNCIVMSDENSFYVFLPSNVDTKGSFSNTLSKYHVPLASPLEMRDGTYEVALVEIFLPNYVYNVISPMHNTLGCGFSGPGRAPYFANLELREGRYSAQEFVRAVNDRMKKAYFRGGDVTDVGAAAAAAAAARPVVSNTRSKQHRMRRSSAGDLVRDAVLSAGETAKAGIVAVGTGRSGQTNASAFRGRLSYNSVSKTISVYLKPGEWVDFPTPRLRDLMGFRATDGGIIRNNEGARGRSYELPTPANFSFFTQQMFVYTNIVAYAQVGNIYAPIIRIVDLDVKSKDEKGVIHRSYQRPQYFKVSGTRIMEIEIQLCDGLGEPIIFRSGTVMLVFHFRKIVKRDYIVADGKN